MSTQTLQEYVFFIRYTRTGVRVLKEMSGLTYEDALKDLQEIQRNFASGQAAFEIEAPIPDPSPATYTGEGRKKTE